jgi:hypothetical protein
MIACTHEPEVLPRHRWPLIPTNVLRPLASIRSGQPAILVRLQLNLPGHLNRSIPKSKIDLLSLPKSKVTKVGVLRDSHYFFNAI